MTFNHRRLFDVELQPAVGTRFQPTGFPDIGTALFDRPRRNGEETEWDKALIVESAQSMANRLEATAWDESVNEPVDVFEGLPYVRVVHEQDDEYLTSSRTEAHRLASAFIKDGVLDGKEGRAAIRERLGLRDDRPLAPRDVARAVFALDPFCLIHGVFFAEPATVWPGQPKIARVLTAFVEAVDVRRADSGGVKKDHVRHSLGEAVGGTAEGYGTVPFHRTEWTAGRIVASFSIDLGQIASYGLGEPASDLLEATALWEIRTLLEGGLRFRTACDLLPLNGEISGRDGAPLPTAGELEGHMRGLVQECSDLVGGGRPIEARWGGGKTRGSGK